ncbi:MAG: DUF2849 domain-containing protein [Hyphomicrobiaceae bacterium]
MAKPFKPQVVTANDLFEGDVVYLAENGIWRRRITEATVAHTPEHAEDILASAMTKQHQVVGPELTEIDIDRNGTPRPVHFREKFRANGPSLDPAIWQPKTPEPGRHR